MQGTLTVKDVINHLTKSKNEWGVQGYELPKFDGKLDKSRAFKIANT